MVGSSSSTNLQFTQGTLDLTYKATLAADGGEYSIKDTVGVSLDPAEIAIKASEDSDKTRFSYKRLKLIDWGEGRTAILDAKINGAKEQDEPKQSMALDSAEMGFDAAIEACQEILSNPFSAEGMIGSTGVSGDNATLMNYGKALKAILYLGPKANSLLPLLKQRRDEIVAALGNEAARPYIGGFQAAISCVQGDRPVATVIAVNGSGLLSQPQEDVVMRSQPALTPKPFSAAYQSNTPKPAVQPAPAQSTNQSQESTQWPWIIGAILLLAVAGGILLKLLRK